MAKIEIDGVDTTLLDQQRKILWEALTRSGMGDHYDESGILRKKELEALEGILNMLDHWSDKIYYERKGVNHGNS